MGRKSIIVKWNRKEKNTTLEIVIDFKWYFHWDIAVYIIKLIRLKRIVILRNSNNYVIKLIE